MQTPRLLPSLLFTATLLLVATGCAMSPELRSADWVMDRSSTQSGRIAALDRSPELPAFEDSNTAARLVRVQRSQQLGLCARIDSREAVLDHFESAFDASGRDFTVVELTRSLRAPGRKSYQVVCANLDSSYLEAMNDSGFSLQFVGANGLVQVDVPAEWIQGFMAYVEQVGDGASQLALQP